VAAALVDPTGALHRRSLGAVFGATFFVRFAFGITLAVFASYIVGRWTGLSGSDTAVVGLVSAMAPIGEFTTVLFSGVAADRYGRFPVLFGGMAGAAVLFALVATTRSTVALGAMNFLFGIASGAILASSLAVVADRSGAGERGFEMGRFDAMNLFGWLGGFAFGIGVGGAIPVASLPLIFLLGAGALAAGLALAALLLRGLPRVSPVRGYPVAQVFRSAFRRNVLLVTLPWLVIYMLIGYVLVFLGTAAKGTGVSTTYLALAIGGGGAVLVLSQPRFGRFADQFGRMRMMTVGATGFVALLILGVLLLQYGAQPILLGGAGVSAVAALAYAPAALAALADLALALSRATTMAIYSLTISLGMIVGLVVSTQLFNALGNLGLDLFFAAIAGALVLLTVARYVEARQEPASGATIPAQ
jgi:MFS family permease